MDFVNRLAALAERKDHHPDLKVGYGYCEVLFTTHDAGGLTALDAECARETQRLADELASAPRLARKFAWDALPGEQVNPSMLRRMIAGDRTLVARLSFKDGFVVPAAPPRARAGVAGDVGHAAVSSSAPTASRSSTSGPARCW